MSKSQLIVTSRVTDSQYKSKQFLARLLENKSDSIWLCQLYEYNERQEFFELVVNNVLINLGAELDVQLFDFVTIINSRVRVVYSSAFQSNTVFTTVRCNSNCIMCSQPPLEVDDGNFNVAIWYKINELLVENGITSLGFSGGEPTILGDDLISLINAMTNKHSELLIDVLSNGRRLGQSAGRKLLERVKHPSRVRFCIPLYSGISSRHDYIVQSKTSFWDTVNGLYNCNYFGLKTEIRLVIQKDTIDHLGFFVEFIKNNLWFVDHFALMGLEQIGYAKSRFEEIDVTNSLRQHKLFQKTLKTLSREGLNVSIYNLPLCYIPEEVHGYARKSISEWKNSFHSDCEKCSKRSNCSGFFSWNLNSKTNVHPFT
jgi:His-Xaa-Ser system radical SAM maturase HxsC